jgi:hypothetical protein
MDQNVWPLPQIKNFQWHECFNDLRCILSDFFFGWKLQCMKFWWKLIFFGGNALILVETISVETIFSGN